MTDYYSIRSATLADVPIIVHHRQAMFTEMDVSGDHKTSTERFVEWLQAALPSQNYFGWLVETESGEVVAGGGVSLLPRPPSPEDLNSHWAFVYNVYTEPAHRRRGLARRIMETIHAWCRARGLKTVALNASGFGRPLYEALGYQPNPTLLMLTLKDHPNDAFSHV